MLTTLGFVISKKNVKEFDREYCFFTKKYGKINLIAKSIRKPLSKLSAQLEPPSLIEIVFVPNSEKGLIITALAKNSYCSIRKNIDKLKIYNRIVNRLDDLSITKQPDEALWSLINTSIKNLNKYNGKIVELNFSAKFLKIIGLAPNMSYCLNCQNKITDNQSVGFDKYQGGVVCAKCVSPKSINLTSQVFKSINILINMPFKEIMAKELNIPIEQRSGDIKKFFDEYIKQTKKYF